MSWGTDREESCQKSAGLPSGPTVERRKKGRGRRKRGRRRSPGRATGLLAKAKAKQQGVGVSLPHAGDGAH